MAQALLRALAYNACAVVQTEPQVRWTANAFGKDRAIHFCEARPTARATSVNAEKHDVSHDLFTTLTYLRSNAAEPNSDIGVLIY